jgi:acetyl-CoA carboxylase, biotin carboxylase subunit
MLESVLVANRGEIASRIIRTCRRLGIRTVAVYSPADAELPFVTAADQAVPLTADSPRAAYMDAAAILAAAASTGVQAIHPGYGFLSENPGFAEQVIAAGHVWVGPDPAVIRLMGDKIAARNYVAELGLPVSPGSSQPILDAATGLAVTAAIGYPAIVKAAAGGGGMGIAVVNDDRELQLAIESVQGFAQRLFGDSRIFVERFYPAARHVEIQILGLADGSVVALGERNCSVQRRNQKLLEEAPCEVLQPHVRERMLGAAVRIGEVTGYRTTGTVECLVFGQGEQQDFVFLEMNTRLQVEHPVTEELFGVDLVEQQLRAAAGVLPSTDLTAAQPRGHAIELRINAEDPKSFLPGPGAISEWAEPSGPGIRVDAGYRAGNTVSPFYDPLLAKLIVHADTRREAIDLARSALARFRVTGPKANIAFFERLLQYPEFCDNSYATNVVDMIAKAGRRASI